MMERPILFSGPMVRAILDGRKTQTRRVFVPPAPFAAGDDITIQLATGSIALRFCVGDRLWVRETWKPHSLYAGLRPRDIPRTPIFFRADDRYAPSNTPWKPGIHMPRWAARIMLEVTGVKVERLHSISGNDAQSEGISIGGPDVEVYRREAERNHEAARRWNAYRVRQFRDLWTSINGPGSWEANPWVVAIAFRVVAPDQVSPGGCGEGPHSACAGGPSP